MKALVGTFNPTGGLLRDCVNINIVDASFAALLVTDSQLWKEHWGEAKVEEREAVRKVGLEPRLSRSREENTDSYTEPEMGSRDLQRDTLAQYSVIESHYYGDF